MDWATFQLSSWTFAVRRANPFIPSTSYTGCVSSRASSHRGHTGLLHSGNWPFHLCLAHLSILHFYATAVEMGVSLTPCNHRPRAGKDQVQLTLTRALTKSYWVWMICSFYLFSCMTFSNRGNIDLMYLMYFSGAITSRLIEEREQVKSWEDRIVAWDREEQGRVGMCSRRGEAVDESSKWTFLWLFFFFLPSGKVMLIREVFRHLGPIPSFWRYVYLPEGVTEWIRPRQHLGRRIHIPTLTTRGDNVDRLKTAVSEKSFLARLICRVSSLYCRSR